MKNNTFPLGLGFLAILLMTWMQTRTLREMLGPPMALMVLSSTGLMPISQAIAVANHDGT